MDWEVCICLILTTNTDTSTQLKSLFQNMTLADRLLIIMENLFPGTVLVLVSFSLLFRGKSWVSQLCQKIKSGLKSTRKAKVWKLFGRRRNSACKETEGRQAVRTPIQHHRLWGRASAHQSNGELRGGTRRVLESTPFFSFPSVF